MAGSSARSSQSEPVARISTVSGVPTVEFRFEETADGYFPAQADEVQETVVEIVPDRVKIVRNHP